MSQHSAAFSAKVALQIAERAYQDAAQIVGLIEILTQHYR
jgi:hypothetical protein